MRLAWATDVHFDHAEPYGVEALVHAVEAAGADGLVLTGDIAEAPSLIPYLERLGEGLEVPLWFVLGNHDYYRGSIAGVRAELGRWAAGGPGPVWLGAGGVVELAPGVGPVGVDGWSDGRTPTWETSRVMLNDYFLIEELRGWRSREELQGRLRALGEAEAAALAPTLEAALARYPAVIVATHPPPFRGACWYQGKTSDDEWAPHFTAVAVGEVLEAAAARWGGRQLTVLCGHTHGAGEFRPRGNLVVRTGGAVYGRPALAGLLVVGE